MVTTGHPRGQSDDQSTVLEWTPGPYSKSSFPARRSRTGMAYSGAVSLLPPAAPAPCSRSKSGSRTPARVASFYDWSPSMTVHKYRDRDNDKNKTMWSAPPMLRGRPLMSGGRKANRMFTTQKNTLTKGELAIVSGICQNRGDIQDEPDPDAILSHHEAWFVGKQRSRTPGSMREGSAYSREGTYGGTHGNGTSQGSTHGGTHSKDGPQGFREGLQYAQDGGGSKMRVSMDSFYMAREELYKSDFGNTNRCSKHGVQNGFGDCEHVENHRNTMEKNDMVDGHSWEGESNGVANTVKSDCKHEFPSYQEGRVKICDPSEKRLTTRVSFAKNGPRSRLSATIRTMNEQKCKECQAKRIASRNSDVKSDDGKSSYVKFSRPVSVPRAVHVSLLARRKELSNSRIKAQQERPPRDVRPMQMSETISQSSLHARLSQKPTTIMPDIMAGSETASDPKLTKRRMMTVYLPSTVSGITLSTTTVTNPPNTPCGSEADPEEFHPGHFFSEGVTEGINEGFDEGVHDRVNERVNEGVNERVNERINERVNARVNESVSEGQEKEKPSENFTRDILQSTQEQYPAEVTLINLSSSSQELQVHVDRPLKRENCDYVLSV